MKSLKFIHITKCAGTSIEDLGLENNIYWGRHHKEYGWWHEILLNKSKHFKDKYDWFMIVRNPYDRILSEYHCFYNNREQLNHSVDEFNLFLINKIKKRSLSGEHYTEQYRYLDSDCNIHILKFENLENDFNNLMLRYNLNIKLNKHIKTGRNKKFQISDFSKELISLINSVYEKDFLFFGYEIMN